MSSSHSGNSDHSPEARRRARQVLLQQVQLQVNAQSLCSVDSSSKASDHTANSFDLKNFPRRRRDSTWSYHEQSAPFLRFSPIESIQKIFGNINKAKPTVPPGPPDVTFSGTAMMHPPPGGQDLTLVHRLVKELQRAATDAYGDRNDIDDESMASVGEGPGNYSESSSFYSNAGSHNDSSAQVEPEGLPCFEPGQGSPILQAQLLDISGNIDIQGSVASSSCHLRSNERAFTQRVLTSFSQVSETVEAMLLDMGQYMSAECGSPAPQLEPCKVAASVIADSVMTSLTLRCVTHDNNTEGESSTLSPLKQKANDGAAPTGSKAKGKQPARVAELSGCYLKGYPPVPLGTFEFARGD
ncbi:hypothetical protein BKA70DRAFT_1214207 [Coprinopsis sp. MPI-PUGE-AT-0042]|nr:hypothetical protein BKA70DRAFT_1214207 [Coprinopsis sp. MPI-PUGE-AT-0042]